MGVHCGECGKRLGSKAELPGHFRRAHSKGRKVRRPRFSAVVDNVKPSPVALVPAKPRLPRPQAIRAEVLEIIPIQCEIVRPISPKRVFCPHPRRSGIDWGIASVPPEERIRQETELVLAAQRREEHNGYRLPGASVSPVSAEGVMLAAVRQPQATDEVVLWSQYHALKALATRLDVGIGSERERVAFEAGLREYNTNYDHIAQKGLRSNPSHYISSPR